MAKEKKNQQEKREGLLGKKPSLHKTGTVFCWEVSMDLVGGRTVGVKLWHEVLPSWE